MPKIGAVYSKKYNVVIIITDMPMLEFTNGLNTGGVGIGKIKYKIKMQNKTISKGGIEFVDSIFIIVCGEIYYYIQNRFSFCAVPYQPSCGTV